ncbi:MAG: hypothetical protein RM368_28800 [Nostoc sp. DedSLP03]|uniref:hypothetical protein n=1 Tax=Nostoc sp. DedSLP03 TaxID=3075400 RepID=UPI002AD5A9A9|nr:hypothetical protein [Nostoc sp. DedSLP03]MDZ7968904.1 hypothetical protein [Nostoc sp. DedSLP03]
MKQLPKIDSNQVLQKLKQIQLDITSIETEPPVMLTEVIGFIRCKVTLTDNRSSQALANFSLTKEGKLLPGEISIEEAETTAIFRALSYLGYETEALTH